MTKATVRKDLIEDGTTIYIQIGGVPVCMPEGIETQTFNCEQPDYLEHDEFNLIISSNDFRCRAKSIDFEFDCDVPQMNEYTVSITQSVHKSHEFTVKAYNEDEANETAKDLADDFDWSNATIFDTDYSVSDL